MAHLGSDAAGPSRPPLSRAAQLAPPPRSHELRFSLAPPASEGGLLLALPGDAASAASSSSSIPSAAPPARLRASKSPLSLSEAQPQRAAPPSATHAELGPLPRSPRPPSLASACALTLAARLRLPPRVFPRSTKPRASAAASGRDSAGAPIDRSDDRQHALTADNLLRAQASVAVGMGILAPAGRVGEATGRGFMPVADDTVVVSPPASTAGASTSGVRSPRSPTVPAWGAPRSWANLASTSNGISISVPASGAASAAASASASPSAPLSPASRRKKSSHSGQQAQKRPQLSLKDRLRAAERSFAAPLTRPRGMINTGNFCFANAILQVLVYCAPFTNLFSLIGSSIPADLSNSTPLMEAVIHFLREFHPADAERSGTETPDEPFAPEFVYDAMRLTKRFDTMRRGHQEDAEEFLGFLLDTLHEELLVALRGFAARSGAGEDADEGAEGEVAGDDDAEEQRIVRRPSSPEAEGWMEVGTKGRVAHTRTTATSDSPITRIFGGKLRSVLRTPGAKDSVTLEPYQPLQLDVGPPSVRSVSDALRNLCVPEVIPGVWSPSRGAAVDATKTVLVESLPPVLVLHLKRFVYDGGEVLKDSKELAFSQELEIDENVIAPARRAEAQRHYRLFGVVYHHGRFASGGHYTVDVLRQDGKQWLHIDDTNWHVCPPPGTPSASAPIGQLNSSIPPRTHNGVAYLLFFARTDALKAATSATADAVPATSASANAPATPAPHKHKANGINGHAKPSTPVAAASATLPGAASTPQSPAAAGAAAGGAAPRPKRVVPGAAPPAPTKKEKAAAAAAAQHRMGSATHAVA